MREIREEIVLGVLVISSFIQVCRAGPTCHVGTIRVSNQDVGADVCCKDITCPIGKRPIFFNDPQERGKCGSTLSATEETSRDQVLL